MRKHRLQILRGDAVVLTLMLLPVLSWVTVTGAGNSSRTLSWNLIVLRCLDTHVQKTPRVQLLDPGEKPCHSCQHGLCSLHSALSASHGAYVDRSGGLIPWNWS